MKHNRLATALVVTGSVLGLAACSWFGSDNNKQASAAPGYSSQPRSTASNSGASGGYSPSGAGSSYSSGSTASSQNYNSGSSSMSSNVGSSRSAAASASNTSTTEIADVQQHLQQLGYYKGRIDGIWGP